MEDKQRIVNSGKLTHAAGFSSFPIAVVDLLKKNKKQKQFLCSHVVFQAPTLSDAMYT